MLVDHAPILEPLPRLRKLSQLMTDHILCDHYRHMCLTIVHFKSCAVQNTFSKTSFGDNNIEFVLVMNPHAPDEIRKDSTPPCVSFDGNVIFYRMLEIRERNEERS